MRKLRLRKVKSFAQGHTFSESGNVDLNRGPDSRTCCSKCGDRLLSPEGAPAGRWGERRLGEHGFQMPGRAPGPAVAATGKPVYDGEAQAGGAESRINRDVRWRQEGE